MVDRKMIMLRRMNGQIEEPSPSGSGSGVPIPIAAHAAALKMWWSGIFRAQETMKVLSVAGVDRLFRCGARRSEEGAEDRRQKPVTLLRLNRDAATSRM